MERLPDSYRGFIVTEEGGTLQAKLEDYLQLLEVYSHEIRLFRMARDSVRDIIRMQDTEEGLRLLSDGLPRLMQKYRPDGTVYEERDGKWGFHELTYEVTFELTAFQWNLLVSAVKNGEIPYACNPVRLAAYRAASASLRNGWEEAYGTKHQEA